METGPLAANTSRQNCCTAGGSQRGIPVPVARPRAGKAGPGRARGWRDSCSPGEGRAAGWLAQSLDGRGREWGENPMTLQYDSGHS